MTPSELRVLERVSDLIREMMEEKGLRYEDLPIVRSTLARGLSAGNIRMATLVRIADALECDVILNFRQRPAARDVQRKGAPL